MSGVQAVHGSPPSAVPKNLDEITDEELLRQLWQEADNYSERRRIRARMYKLREKRLREMVENDEESLGTLATTDQGTYGIEKSEAKVTVTNPQRKSSNIEINLQVRGDSAVTDSISMHNVKLGGLTMRGIGCREPNRTPSDEEIIVEKVEETKKIRNDRFNKIMNIYEQTPSGEAVVSVSKTTYSVQNNAFAGDSYQSMKHKEVRDSASPTRYDYSKRIAESNRDLYANKSTIQYSSDDASKSTKKSTSLYGKSQRDSVKRVTARKLSKEKTTSPITISKKKGKKLGKQNTDKISTKEISNPSRKPMTKEMLNKNEYNKLDSYLNTCTDLDDELITEEEEVLEDESGNIVKMLIQTRRKKDGTEYISRRIARTTKVVDSEKDINEILIGNPDHEIVHRNIEEKVESDGSKIKIICETRRRPDGIEYQTKNILKTSKIFDYDHPENVRYSEDDELINVEETKEIDENGVEILTVTEIRRKSTGEEYTTKKVYKTSKVTSEISPSTDDEVLDRKETEETSPEGVNVKVVTERRKTHNGEEYTHKQVFKARKMTLSDIELLQGLPSLVSEDELVDKIESDETDEAGNIVKKVTEMRKKKDGSQYSFDYVVRSVKGTEQEIKDIPYKVCDSAEICTSINDKLINEDVKEVLQEDGSTVKTIIERRKNKSGTEYLRHRIIHIPKLPEPELQVASKDDEVLEEDINEDVLDDGTQFRAVTERRRSSTTGLQYTLRRMSKVFHPTIHLFGVDEIIDENITEEETSEGVLTRTVIRRYQRPDDSVYTTHNVSKTYKNPVKVMPSECSNDELVDRSYDVRETHDGFLIRTVMETRCRADGVHYTVERTEKISKNKSTLKLSTTANDSLLTGSPGDTVISREQHEEPGEVGIIIKTVLEVRRRKDGTEYTNKSIVKTTQILVPQHETSYVIIKPDPKNTSGKIFMPSLNDEIIYTRNKEEIDEKGNTINIILETRKSIVTGEKYNLTKRVRTTDVVMTDHGEKVLSKNKQTCDSININTSTFSKDNMNQGITKLSRRGTTSTKTLNNTVNRHSSVKKFKEEGSNSQKSVKISPIRKKEKEENKILSSTTNDENQGDSMIKKANDTKKLACSNNIVKDRSIKTNSVTKTRSHELKTTKITTDNVTKKINRVFSNKKSSGSSSEATSESYSPDRSNNGGKYSTLSKKSSKSESSDERTSGSVKSTKKTIATEKTHNKINGAKEFNICKKENKSNERSANVKRYQNYNITKHRSSDDDSGRENKIIKSITGSKLEKKSPSKDTNYIKSISSPLVVTKMSSDKRNSLPVEDIPLSSQSTNERAVNYVNLVKKRNSKSSIEEAPNRSNVNSTRSTNITSAIRDKYSKPTNSPVNSNSKANNYVKLEKSIMSQIIPDTPKLNQSNRTESRSLGIKSDRITENVTSKRSMFEKYSDVKNVELTPTRKENTPVIESAIVPKHITPMYKTGKATSADVSNMKSRDLKLASTKLVMDTMQPESRRERDESPSKEFKTDILDKELNSTTKASITCDTPNINYNVELKTKKVSTSSVDSFLYERQDSGSFVKETSPTPFITGKPIDQGVNTNKIKKLERAGSNKKLLEDLEKSVDVTLSFAQNIDIISDLTELENILNNAESYEERRLIRGRIRNVKRLNQSQQSNRLGKSVNNKYSFKSPSNLSPRIQRRSEQLTGKSVDMVHISGKEGRNKSKSTKAVTPSVSAKLVSSISKSFSEKNKKETEIRKISSSSVDSTELNDAYLTKIRKSSSSNISEIWQKSSAEDKCGKSKKTVEGIINSGRGLSSDGFISSKNNFELTSNENSSQKYFNENIEERSIEKPKVQSDGKPYSEPLRHQKLISESSEKYQTDVEKIISPYGVGPTDENGLPLFGLIALKRKDKPTDTTVLETKVSTEQTKTEEQEESIEVKAESDELDGSLNMDPDSLSEVEDEKEEVRSKNFRNIVMLHESKVSDPITVVEATSPPKQKLRQEFVAQEDKIDRKTYKTWNLESDLATKSEFVENIIAKHETLSMKETPKIEKRLAGILKKSNSSLSSSKVTDEIAFHKEESSEREYTKNYETATETTIERVNEMTDEKSFLNDRTKVTGISDVIARMGATEAVDHETKVTSDDQARSLLNRFLGAQVLMTGVESMMAQSATSQNRSLTAFGEGITNPTTANGNPASSTLHQSAPDIINGVNINEVNDSFELNELLDSCERYEERRRLRLRLKDIVAQEKASGDIIGLKKVTSTTRQIAGSKFATVGSSEGKGSSAFNKFKKLDAQQSHTTSGPQVGGPLFALSTSLNRSASGVKDMIMTWCQCRTRNYKGVKIENFSTSWNDGMAFCALIHHFYPDAFNFDQLNPKNRRYNFALAFRTADERADVYPLLDVEDMVAMQKPDWKCVFTYVQTLYKRLKDE